MKRLIIFILAIVVLGGLYGLYLYNKKPADTREEKADFELQAAELMKAFTTNETEATQKYADKVLLITGKVNEINITSATVFLDASDAMASITCSFYANEVSSLSKIKKGDVVQIKGKCTGKLIDVVLNNCSLITSK